MGRSDHREHNQAFPTLARHAISPAQVICRRFASPTTSFEFPPPRRFISPYAPAASSTSLNILDKTSFLLNDADVRGGQSTATLEENVKNPRQRRRQWQSEALIEFQDERVFQQANEFMAPSSVYTHQQ
ncbi:hypothetical protein ARMGADRAFT_1083110 [Armillaria gallica]|uniref:Uncharacterized protein n=1 Tax=Armillaria gallica TaxID=47427 RepID=A0A2H3D8Z3_ARMGA|nr:hypothetical protein ARMGADRAFT_1083110 [Armillaria gallica]